MITAHNIFIIATVFYILGLVSSCLRNARQKRVWFFLVVALVSNAATLCMRYQAAWPMLPMYLSPVALPFCLVFLTVFMRQNDISLQTRRMILSLTCIIALITVFFPKDFYLPFLKSNTLLAHFFFFFGVIGKGCFLVASAWAVIGLFQEHRGISQETVNTSDVTVSNSPQVSLSAHYYWFPWAVWGFAFWTLSMFSGELWSYLGWGTPVVWDDPAITTTMATWFFYICLLHLHLTGTWTARGRTAYAASGILVVLILNYIPQLGPYRWPF